MTSEIRAYVSGLAVISVTASLALLAARPGDLDLTALLVLAVVTAIAEVVPVRFVHAGQTQGFTLQSAAVVALLLSGFGHVTPALVMALAALVHAVRSRSWIKTTFNAARSGVESSVAVVVFLMLAPDSPSPTDVRSLVATVAAVSLFEITSMLLTTELMARLGGRGRRGTFTVVRGLWGVNVVGNLAYGIVLATVMTVEVWVGALTGLMMLVMYVGYRGYAAAVSGERRARALNEMTRLLIDLPGERDVAVVLHALVAVFECERGVIVAEAPDGVTEWRCETSGNAERRSLAERPRSGIVATVMARRQGLVETGPEGDGAEAMAAPIIRGGEAIGAIVMTGRLGIEPWGPSDLSLLTAVANEFAVALDNVALFGQVEEERSRLEAESTKVTDILTAATDGILAVTGRGVIEAWNPGMARITGVDPDVAIGQPWHAVLRLRDVDGRELPPTGDHVVSRIMSGEQAGATVSLQALRADGVWRWLQCTSSPVRQHDGDPGMVIVARDVTTERELEELKADFIATVSHELRTPLTPLKGFLATLRNPRTPLSDEQLATIHGAMGSQLVRLETLISDLLAVAELDHGQFVLQPEPLELTEMLVDAVKVEAADESHRCDVDVRDGLTGVADPVALVRIVRSLVSNALKHTTGPIHVSARSGDDHVEVLVSDEGPGIASWDQQRVFNRFERLGNHLTRTQGPGLGLTIARTLARRMDGDILLESDIGAGATFVLRLPRPRPRPVPLQAVSEA